MPSRSLYITRALYCTPRKEPAYYEIQATDDREVGRALVLVTRDDAVFDAACHLEGEPLTTPVTWRAGRRPNSAACFVIESFGVLTAEVA